MKKVEESYLNQWYTGFAKTKRTDSSMTNCNPNNIPLSNVKNRKVTFEFSGGDVTSDGGSLLLREVDLSLNLTRRAASALPDDRRKNSCVHSQHSLLQQRVYALALGYEDVNDHESLRLDPGFQTVLGQIQDLASSPTLSRFENRADRKWAWNIHEVLFDTFVSSFKTPPEQLILDFDSTDDPIHGNQEGRHFHGYYDKYCFLPLYVFCEDQLLVSYLRPSKIDGAKHAWAILSLLVKKLRTIWPDVQIIFRGDSGFCRPKMLTWCEKHGVDYIVGLAKNNRLREMSKNLEAEAKHTFTATKKKQRLFSRMEYAANSWTVKRSVIAKAEYTEKGSNPRFIVTTLKGDAQFLYDKVYCARGEMENRIKEQQLDLFADRTSCTAWYANQFRLLLSSLGYVLLETIRRLGLSGTDLARAQCQTIRLKLLKIGAVVLRNTRRIRFLLSSSYPYKKLFENVLAAFSSG